MFARFVQARVYAQSSQRFTLDESPRPNLSAPTARAAHPCPGAAPPRPGMNDLREEPQARFADPIASLRTALRGRYDIEREIGQGAFATVYLARDLRHERNVALKVLNADPTSDTSEIRFIREIRTLARLQHPNILPLHDSGHVEALLYYVMPYVGGETLRDRMNRERQMSVDAACTIARETADALSYAHAQGIVHRDIKPENILLSGGHPVISDFGIARVIDVAGVRQLTRTGMGAPGTPAYMSPEQLMGDRNIDGRSDTYSLGCVLFEMLTGRPPFAGKEGFAKRFTEAPPSVSSTRKDLPEWLDGAIGKALERDPSDRYQTASEFVAALCAPGAKGLGSGSNPERGRVAPASPAYAYRPGETHLKATSLSEPVTANPSATEHRASRAMKSAIEQVRSRPLAAFTALSLVALVTLGATLGPRRLPDKVRAMFMGSSTLDSTRFVVLPLAAQNQDEQITATQVSEGLYDALERNWDGLTVVEAAKVDEAIRRHGALPVTQTEALDLAKQLEAGRLIWGQVLNDSQIRATLYDVSTGERSNEVGLELSTREPGAFARAAMDLLTTPGRPGAADGGDIGTRSFPAWRSYGRGHIALAKFDLAGAEVEFRAATEADQSYAAAQLWLAQTRALRSYSPVEAWREQAERALAHSTGLRERDLALANALAAMAHAEYGSACDWYRKLVARDSADYIAWYGLGFCGVADNALVADRAHPNTLSFRSSYLAASKAFDRATQLEPRLFTVLPFGTLLRVAPIQPTQIRPGIAAGKPTRIFLAYPSFVAETLAYIPFPFADVQGGKLRTAPRTAGLAAQRSRQFLLRLVLRWAHEFPRSAEAQEALAILQEASGELGADREGVPSALTAVQSAERLTADGRRKTLLVAREIRLRLKRNEFERARRLSDSLLASVNRNPELSSDLAGLAALTGRIALTQHLLRPADILVGSRDPAEPLPHDELMAAATALFVRAALGACSEDFAGLATRIDQLLESHASLPQRRLLRDELTSSSWSMAVPCHPDFALRVAVPVTPLLHMQQAFARSEPAVVRARFDTLAKLRENDRPGDVTPDVLYQEAWLLAAMGDTAAAIRRLDPPLTALSTLGNVILDLVPQAAALVRAMILRADLAHGQGDDATARKWALAASILWANADPPLQPVVHRMQTMARSHPAPVQPKP